MNIIESLAHKKVLILGLGREGMSTFLFLRRLYPLKRLALADKQPIDKLADMTRNVIESDPNVICFSGQDYLATLSEYDVVFKAPGIPPTEISQVIHEGTQITSNSEVFFEECPGITVGITGTKGKSTTTSLIYEVLKNAGLDVRLTGNIGIPPLSSLENANTDTIFVIELSSYQLSSLHTSPHIAVLQNVVPEHLNYHGSFEAYVEAKKNIVRYQTDRDYYIFNASFEIPRDFATTTPGKKIPYGLTNDENFWCFVEEGSLIYNFDGAKEKIISTQDVPLKGKFNLQNVMPSIIVAKLFIVSNDVFARTIKTFLPLEHRLEFVGSIKGISFYNDSLATIPQAAVSAIQSFPGKRFILLLGGYDRGLEFGELASVILANNCKAVILFPTTGEKIWDELVKQAHAGVLKLPVRILVSTMIEAVRHAYELAEEGDIVLLSPAAASFSVFQDYRDRGDQFRNEVHKLIQNHPINSPSV